MNQIEQDAVKRALAEEFGLSQVDDSDESRLLVRSKLAEMNPLDRAAFEMRVGRLISEAESSGAPKSRSIFLSYAILAVIGWFIWRPSAVVLAITASGKIRSFAIRHALFWSSGAAVAIGSGYGILLAVLVRFGIALSTHTTTAGVAFSVFGFLAAGYIGHRVPAGAYAEASGDEKRVLAQMAALGCYLVAVIVLYFMA
jgi:hypothetical protein